MPVSISVSSPILFNLFLLCYRFLRTYIILLWGFNKTIVMIGTWILGKRVFTQNIYRAKVKVKSLSCVWLFVTPRTVAYQAPLSMGFSRQEYCSGLTFLSPGDLLRNFEYAFRNTRNRKVIISDKLDVIEAFLQQLILIPIKMDIISGHKSPMKHMIPYSDPNSNA